jgi:hypothetical protein
LDGGTTDAGVQDAGAADAGMVDAGDWSLPAYGHRAPLLTLTSRLEDTGAVVLLLEQGAGFSYSEVLADGKDLRIVSADGTEMLPTAIARYSAVTPQLVMWFRAPTVPAGAGERVAWLYWGSANATPPNGMGLWQDYDAAYPMSGSQNVAAATYDITHLGGVDAAGIVGSARAFDCTTSSYAEVVGFPNPRALDFTIEAWVKGEISSGEYAAIVSKRWETGFAITRSAATDKTSLFLARGDAGPGQYEEVVGNDVVFDDGWHHVVATRAGQLVSLWVDGVLDNAGVLTPVADLANAFPLRFGMDPANPNECLVGRVDEVRVRYGYAASAAEVSAGHAAVRGELFELGTPESNPSP